MIHDTKSRLIRVRNFKVRSAFGLAMSLNVVHVTAGPYLYLSMSLS